MTRDIYVQARADYIASLASAAPVSAIEELVWNALDADAHEVRIDVVQNALGAVEAIRVSDDGSGIDILKAEQTFGSLGGSWKMKNDVTTTAESHRRLHGRHGCGRFKAFALGSHVEWRTTMRAGEDLLSYTLASDSSEPGVFHIEQMEPGPGTGTEVYITNVRSTADSLAQTEAAIQALAVKFALYLKAYPGVSIWFCGMPVSPVIVQKAVTDYEVKLESGATAKLELIEWRKKFSGKGRIVFCGADGFTLHERPAGIRSGQPFSYTAYIVGARFGELAGENALVMDELHPEVRQWLEAVRKILKKHFKVRAKDAAGERLAKWIAEKSYPFAAEDDSPERDRFDEGVAEMRANIESFDSLTAAERTYLFKLLLKTVSQEIV